MYTLYLGITRARTRLYLTHIENKSSYFLAQLFPEAPIYTELAPNDLQLIKNRTTNKNRFNASAATNELEKHNCIPEFIKYIICGQEKTISEFNPNTITKQKCRTCVIEEQRAKCSEKFRQERKNKTNS